MVLAGRGELSLRPVAVAGVAAIDVCAFPVSTSDQPDDVEFLHALGRCSGQIERQVPEPAVAVLAIRFAMTPRIRTRKVVIPLGHRPDKPLDRLEGACLLLLASATLEDDNRPQTSSRVALEDSDLLNLLTEAR